MRDSTSFKRLLMRIDSQWRQTRRRGRVWKQGFRQKAEEVSRDKTLAHKHTQGEEQVQSYRQCFTVEANMLLDVECPSWKNYKTKPDTNMSDSQPREQNTDKIKEPICAKTRNME